MLLGQGRAQSGHRVGDAHAVAADDVDLSFAQHAGAGLDHGLARAIQCIEHAALAKDGGLGRIEVFAAALIAGQDAPAEGQHPVAGVADGKHEAVPEAVVNTIPLLVAGQQSGLDEQGLVVALLFGPAQDDILGRGVADAEGLHDVRSQLPVFQIGAGRLGGSALAQDVLVEAHGLLVHPVEQILARVLAPLLFILHQYHIGPLGQQADRTHEVGALDFFDERKGVAALAAAEAVKTLAGGVDGEGGGLLLVERAQSLERGAGPFEVNIGTDQVHDVQAFADGVQNLA